MNYRGWLARTWPGDWASLGRELHARWPADIKRDNTPEALANRLATTDAGKSSAKWWAAHDALIAPLAGLLHRPESEVRAWIDGTTQVRPDRWSPPGLRSIVGARVDEPPSGLWPELVVPWVEQVDAGRAETRKAWLTFEPGVAGDWLKEWFEFRGWNVLRAATWAEAEGRLKPRSRNLVHLTGSRPVDRAVPTPRSTSTVCVLASYAPTWSSRPDASGAYGRRWDEPPVSREEWALLDRRYAPDARDCLAWFAKLSREERRLDDDEVAVALRELGAATSVGELLMRLDVGRDDDPVTAMAARWSDVSLPELLAFEREAARRGIGPRRSRETWVDLVPRPASAEDTLAEVRRSLSKNNVALAKRLVDGRPEAIVSRLIALGVLQPCTEPDAPADAWQVWPRWFGAALASRAVSELAAKKESIGTALLASEEGCATAMGNLARMVASSEWDRARALLGTSPDSASAVAAIESTVVAIGHGILDGVDVPLDLATTATAALSAIRARSGGARLLAHGPNLTSHEAVTLAEWALGHRANSTDPRFGPWASGPALGDVHLAALRELDAALDRWGRAAADARRSEERAVLCALARRAMRLGTLLFEQFGPLAVADDDERGVWSLQVPALLVAASRGRDVLPGRTVDEVLRAQVPGVDLPAMAAEGERLFAGGILDVQDTERAGRALLAVFAKQFAADAPAAKARERATNAILKAASSRFSLVKAEIEAIGGSALAVMRWLWSRWNDARWGHEALPPVSLLQVDDLTDACLVWAAAPAVINPEIWKEASRQPSFWDALPESAWRAWAAAGNDAEAGWARMPGEVLVSLLDARLPQAAYGAAWNRAPGPTLAWLLPRLPADDVSSPSRRCLDATPSVLVPEVLAQAPAGTLPLGWLQHVVTRRLDGWRDAWSRLDRMDERGR